MIGRPRRSLLAVAAAAALAMAGCGGDAGDEQATPTPEQSPESPSPTATDTPEDGAGADLEVEAEDISFDEDSYTVSAGANVTVEFKNRDQGIPHNFAVYESSDAQQEIFVGEVITGEAETTYDFQAPAETGTYFFRCDVHPEQMTGDFVVE